ncbi:pyridoxal-phosphate dependent enzyme [Agrobacterium sp. S2]|nr:pyridoxal-phosphate dependent enzyme [Agrobacterium sp. S2]
MRQTGKRYRLNFKTQRARPVRRSDRWIQNSKEIRLVDESRQHAGSLKYRGAILGVSRHAQGVVACGSGNFPTTVVLAASKLSVPATVVMPLRLRPEDRRHAERV